MSARTRKLPAAVGGRTAGISRIVLVAGASFGGALGAERVTARVAAGVRSGGRWETDECPLPGAQQAPAATLDGTGFDARMRRSRALVIAAQRLSERTLAGSVAFEMATRARQAGVPAYAITARDRLGAFDARMLDLQVVLEACDADALRRAGAALARLL